MTLFSVRIFFTKRYWEELAITFNSIARNIKIITSINNLLLTEREGRTGEYWPEVVAVQIERSEVRAKTAEGQYFPVRLELARLVSSLLYGPQVMLVLNLPAFESKKYAAYDRFHGNENLISEKNTANIK